MSAYVDGVLVGLLRASLADLATGVVPDVDSRVYTRQPADLADRVPCVVARQVPGSGGTSVGPLADTARDVQVQVDAYAATARAAHLLADRALASLTQAARSATTTSDGYLTAVELSQPFDGIDAAVPGGLARWTVTGTVCARLTSWAA